MVLSVVALGIAHGHAVYLTLKELSTSRLICHQANQGKHEDQHVSLNAINTRAQGKMPADTTYTPICFCNFCYIYAYDPHYSDYSKQRNLWSALSLPQRCRTTPALLLMMHRFACQPHIHLSIPVALGTVFSTNSPW